jgi:hypothetical protein
MNFAGLSKGTKVLLGAGLLLFIDSFLAWQQISVGVGNFKVTASANMWHGIGFLAGLLVIALLIWEGLQIAGITGQLQLPVSAALVSVGLAALTALITIIKVLVVSYRHWPAWIGLILAIAIAAGGWFKFSESPATAPTTTTTPPA